MQKFIALICFVFLVGRSFAQKYTLDDYWSGNNFFNNFNFFSGKDPTEGYVTYVNQATAQSNGLINVTNNIVIIASDSTHVASGSGRLSVRISSKKSYNGGLFVFDLNHMPTGCGNWPAIWTFGPGWPNAGEIDIIEGVNTYPINTMTLHTSNGCTMQGVARKETGNVTSEDCYVSDPNQGKNQGCGVHATSNLSFGQGFNNNKGGVYAMQWSAQGINIWFFPRQSIPSDINSNSPNPSAWGVPLANFPFGNNCSPSHFSNHNIVVDNTFCGDWAGAVYSSMGCPGTCQSFVKNNPQAFSEAYWSINYFKTFMEVN